MNNQELEMENWGEVLAQFEKIHGGEKMKIPRLCQKCRMVPRIFIATDIHRKPNELLGCLKRYIYKNDLQFPKTQCYYFEKKEG